jgi:hypothetical protein
MPLNSTQLWVQSLLQGLIVPGNAGQLQAYITPEDPRDTNTPAAYIWPARGDEERQSMPRANAPGVVSPGWKIMVHDIDVYLTWFNDDSDPEADITFPAVIDCVMDVLRSSADPAVLTDALTGRVSQLIDLGEKMTWTFGGVRATADQRYLRYDALLTLTVTEELQS